MPLTLERSPDTDAVIDVLRGCNGEIAYQDLAARAALDIGRMKAVLGSARRALRNDGILFGAIWGVGLRRLSDIDKVRKPEAFKKRVMRGAGREIKDLGTISDFANLSKADQHSVTLNRTLLHAIRQSASVKPGKVAATTPTPVPNTAALIQGRRQ